MKKAKIILCMLLALVMAFSLFACNQTTQTDTSASSSDSGTSSNPTDSPEPTSSELVVVKPSTISIGVSGWLGRFLDGAQPAQNISACSAVYDQLFIIDADTKQPYSNILESWEYTDDLTFVMTLKPSITFTNGDVATADDLLYSVMNHVERNDIFVAWFGPMDFENCTSDGEYTVTLKFTAPYGPGLYGTTMYLFDQSWCEQVGWDSPDWYSNPNGTGPYEVTEYVTDDHMTLVLKNNYWNTANEMFDVREWIIKYYPDTSTMYMALEKGDIALCAVSNVADYERWKSEGNENLGMKLCSMGGNLNFFMGPNNNPIFNDINVREALAYGIDWTAMGQLVMGELYVAPTSCLTADSPFYKNVGAYTYDPDKAMQILEDAGYKDGDLKIHLFEMSNDTHKNMAEAFQFYCSELGIEVDLEFGDVTSALSVWMQDGGSDAGWYNNIFGVLDSEPHKSLNCFYVKGFTWCLSDDQAVIDKFMQALNNVDQAERIRLYQELQQTVYDDFLIFPVYEDVAAVGYRTEVFTQTQIDSNVFSGDNFDLHSLSLAAG